MEAMFLQSVLLVVSLVWAPALHVVGVAEGANILFLGRALTADGANSADLPSFTFLNETLGHAVTYGTCETNVVTPQSAATGVHLIVVSSTCSSATLRTEMPWIPSSASGVLTWEYAYADELYLSVNYATYSSNLVEVLADSAQHAATASLTSPGNEILFSSSVNIGEFYDFAPDVRALTGGVTTGRYGVILAEVDGRLRNSILAPGRRAVFPAFGNAFQFATEAAKQVFTNLIAWTADINDRPQVSMDVILSPMRCNDTSIPITVAAVTRAAGWTDADAAKYAVFSGIAIVGTSTVGGGYWQWSANGANGVIWSNISLVSDVDALHLAAWNNDTSIRFIPQADVPGTNVLRFRAWDRSNVDPSLSVTGTRGNTSSTRSRGEPPYSQDIVSVKIDTVLFPVPESTSARGTTGTTGTSGATFAPSISTSRASSTGSTSSSSSTRSTSPPSPPSPPTAVVSASSSPTADFPLWIIFAAIGACLCCLLFVGLVTVRSRRKHHDDDQMFDDDSAYDDAEEEHYDRITSVEHGKAQYKSAVAVVAKAEGTYANIPSVSKVVEGNYARIPQFQQTGDTFSEGVAVLNAEEVMLDMSRRVGKGSFGDVFRGMYRGVDVAVKMLKNEFTSDQLQSFYSEAEMIAAVPPHEFIVGFLGVTPSPFMILTEFCGQGSVKRFLRSTSAGQMSNAQALKLIADVAEGMRHLSSHGIVHRDLAARNVLLTNNLTPKIADFGLSRKIDESQKHHSKSSTGPIRWMSVECIRKGIFSEASDVWSFAVFAYETITRGSTPYGNKPNMEVARMVLAGHRLEYPDVVSQSLIELFKLCMLEDPTKRPTFEAIVQQMDEEADAGEIIYADLGTLGTLEGDGATEAITDLNQFRNY